MAKNKAPLSQTHPQLAAEWHPTENGKITPNQLTAGSNEKINWICSKDHVWQTTINHRTKGSGCPTCAGRKVKVRGGKKATNGASLASLRPDLAAEWHSAKNKLTPHEVTLGSGERVFWCCSSQNHVWEARVVSRVKGSGCPTCSGQRVMEHTSLAALYPNLAAEWHPTENGTLTATDVLPGSGKEVVWICSTCHHEWKAVVGSRAKAGRGCPNCAGRIVTSHNSLAALRPDLVAEWHPTENGTLKPKDFLGKSSKKVFWLCSNCHESWRATINNRANGNGCPFCSGRKVSARNSLLALRPDLAAEWHPTMNKYLTPSQVTAGSGKQIWWQCSKNSTHVWQRNVCSRVAGYGCPVCSKGWNINSLRGFIASLEPYLPTLTPAELYAVFEQSGLMDSQSKTREFIKAFATGRFPLGEVKKFVVGEPSWVDEFISQKESIDVVNNPDSISPPIDTQRVLESLNVPAIKSADEKTIDFLLASAAAKLWKCAYADEATAIQRVNGYDGGGYGEKVKKQFLKEYQKAALLKLPTGYSFQVNGNPAPPNLMQRHLAVLVQTRKHVGNWSGAGAGKTLSAMLASRVIDAKLTIVCCPNNVVDGWKATILNAFPDSVVSTKTFYPEWQTGQSQKKTARKQLPSRYLILNYEAFQQPNSAEHVQALIEREQIDFIVIDEIHFAKQRDPEAASKRRKLITAMRTVAGQRNPNLHVLGMSATPVINELEEGKGMVELVTGTVPAELETRPTVFNCMALHRELVKLGVRWVPNYDIACHELLTPVSCAEFLDDIKTARTTLELERFLTQARLPVIREHVQSGTLIYTHLIDGIDEAIQAALVEDGWKVGFFTGKDKSGLNDFLDGKIDVLIGSSAIGTGIDRLQHVCSKLVVNVLPWTAAEYEQLKGRIYRQGQKSDSVSVVIPVAQMDVNGELWSWCKTKMERLKFKKSIADAAVDGIVPEDQLRTPEQAFQDVMGWLERLESQNLLPSVGRSVQAELLGTNYCR